MSPKLSLVPFTVELLPRVQPWFRHPEVQRRLGGPEWPERELRLRSSGVGEEFRGRTVLRGHSWVVMVDAQRPIAEVGGDVYDRWTTFDGSQPEERAVTAFEPGPAMGLAYVVDPACWGRGLGRTTLRLAVAHSDVADVQVFAAGIDADNLASQRCATAAGFSPDTILPDWEDTIYYLFRRE